MRQLVLATVMLLAASAAEADAAFPSRAITLVVPYPAGGTTDVVARKLAEELGKRIQQPVIVENIGGGSGSIGARKVATAAPDGYTLLAGSVNEMVLTPLALAKPTYRPSQFRAVIINYASPVVLLVGAQRPVATMRDFAALARAQRLSYGTTGAGTFHHVFFHTLAQRLGADMLHVPYKGGAAIVPDAIGGQIDAVMLPVVTAAAQAAGGRLRPLAVSSPTRSPALPDVPTLAESLPELKGFDMTLWAGIFAPVATPRPVVDRLNALLREAHEGAAMQAYMRGAGSQVPAAGLDVDGAQRFVEAEERRHRATVPAMKLPE